MTPEGQACYEGFREVLELYDTVDAKVRSLQCEIAGTVRVAAIYSIGLHEMSRRMQEFMRRYPKAKIHLEYLGPTKVYDAVQNGEVDLGIVSYPLESSEIQIISLRSEDMVLVCPPGHRLAGKKKVNVAQIKNEEFVGFSRELTIRKEIDRHLRKREVSVKMMMEFDNIETIKQGVEIGCGVSILPEPTIQREMQSGRLVAIPLVGRPLRRPIGIIHRQRKIFTPTAMRFIELLQQVHEESPLEEG